MCTCCSLSLVLSFLRRLTSVKNQADVVNLKYHVCRCKKPDQTNHCAYKKRTSTNVSVYTGSKLGGVWYSALAVWKDKGGQRECSTSLKCSPAWWASAHEHTYHSDGVSHAKSSPLSPACDVTAVLLYLLQQLADLLAVIGHFAFLQKSFQLDGSGEKKRGWQRWESAR